jgi:hypothetical protein
MGGVGAFERAAPKRLQPDKATSDGGRKRAATAARAMKRQSNQLQREQPRCICLTLASLRSLELTDSIL